MFIFKISKFKLEFKSIFWIDSLNIDSIIFKDLNIFLNLEIMIFGTIMIEIWLLNFKSYEFK